MDSSSKTALETSIKRVLDILVPRINSELQDQSRNGPLILGITGLQGSGKSTWANSIVQLLTTQHSLRAITISLDDLYKCHDDLVTLREQYPENKLFRTRGQPGTHDENLAGKFFKELKERNDSKELKIPSFDKSKFNGEGDRAPQEEWPRVEGKIDVVVFEGWCVGFQPLSVEEIRGKWEDAKVAEDQNSSSESITTLKNHQLEHLVTLNHNLERYCDTFMSPQHFDFLVHIDTDDLRNVYRWRIQQEHDLKKMKGMGMTDEQVRAFVGGYMPGYELYLDQLRKGFFKNFKTKEARQIRVVLDRERKVEGVIAKED